MMNNLATLFSLPRAQLLVMANATLSAQAAKIYAPEALPLVQDIFRRNTEIMEAEQLAFIVARGGR